MKKLLFLLFLSPLVLFGQTNQNNINVKTGNESISSKAIDRNQEMRDRKADNYLGDGVYEIIRIGRGRISQNKEKFMMEELTRDANQLVLEKGAENFEIIFKDFDPMIFGQQPALLNIRLKLLDNEGNAKLEINETRDDAKSKLIELKEFLDLGIITQEEFDEKAAPLKKILLEN